MAGGSGGRDADGGDRRAHGRLPGPGGPGPVTGALRRWLVTPADLGSVGWETWEPSPAEDPAGALDGALGAVAALDVGASELGPVLVRNPAACVLSLAFVPRRPLTVSETDALCRAATDALGVPGTVTVDAEVWFAGGVAVLVWFGDAPGPFPAGERTAARARWGRRLGVPGGPP